MVMKISIIVVVCCILQQLVSAQIQVSIGLSTSALEDDFYRNTCPGVEPTVRGVVASYLQNPNLNVTAALLKMHFNDCFVTGCDASILIDSTPDRPSEKEAKPNLLLSQEAYKLIDEVKTKLEENCPLVVSCADILILATRESVLLSSGIFYSVKTGRRDGLVSDSTQVNLPGPDMSVTDALEFFTARDISLHEMVALLGAHSVGKTHCSVIKSRFENDPSMDPELKASLSETCEVSGDEHPIYLDENTPLVVDNEYYKQIMKKRGVLQIDQNLGLDESSAPTVESFSSNNNLFEQRFINAMIKMGEIGVLVGTEGEIRKNCRSNNL